MLLKLNAAFTYVAITYLKIKESSLCSIRAPLRTFKNRWISLDDVKLPAMASNIRAIKRTHLRKHSKCCEKYAPTRPRRRMSICYIINIIFANLDLIVFVVEKIYRKGNDKTKTKYEDISHEFV